MVAREFTIKMCASRARSATFGGSVSAAAAARQNDIEIAVAATMAVNLFDIKSIP